MPRAPRAQLAGGIYHVLSRGAVRQAIYRDHVDRQRFLDILGEIVGRLSWRCHAYCLMTNHYHLLVQLAEPNLAAGMHAVNGLYAQWFNRRHGVTGHVFEARYTSILVERDAHLLELTRYLALNPVRAGACADPGDWPWSSYRATAGLESPPRWLSAELVLALVGGNEREACSRYRRFVSEDASQTDRSGGQAPGPVRTGRRVGEERAVGNAPSLRW